jgi:hypothetical protein
MDTTRRNKKGKKEKFWEELLIAYFVLTAISVLMRNEVNNNTKNAVFWDVTPRGSCKNRRFGGT